MLGPPSSAGRVKCQAHLWSYTLAPTGLREAADGLEGTVLVGLQSWGCVLWDMVPAAEPLVATSQCPQGQLTLQRKRHLVERIGNGDKLVK